MSLTTRLLLFFLGTLACVLAGVSLSLYALAGAHPHRQADSSARAALYTLTAAAEAEHGWLEWDTKGRHLLLPADSAGNAIPWLVLDEEGRRVDSSPVVSRPELFSTQEMPAPGQ